MNTPCGYGRPSWFERSNRHDRLRYHFQATALGVEVHSCNGVQVYLEFSQKHDGTFGTVINADGLEKLKSIYGVTQYGVNNSNCVYTGNL